jgi:acyl carrier protein
MGNETEAFPDIKIGLREFITDNFLPSSGQDSFEDSDSFMETGIIDSTGVLELLEYIEEAFSIQVEDEEVVPDNMDSLDKLAAFIGRKKAGAGQ